MVELLVLVLIAAPMSEVLAEPIQTADMDRDGETGTVASVWSDRSPSTSLSDIIMLANLIVAVINILLTYSIGRRHSP